MYVRIKKTDASKLQDEYQKLVEGLQDAANAEDSFASNPGTQSTGLDTAPGLTDMGVSSSSRGSLARGDPG